MASNTSPQVPQLDQNSLIKVRKLYSNDSLLLPLHCIINYVNNGPVNNNIRRSARCSKFCNCQRLLGENSYIIDQCSISICYHYGITALLKSHRFYFCLSLYSIISILTSSPVSQFKDPSSLYWL